MTKKTTEKAPARTAGKTATRKAIGCAVQARKLRSILNLLATGKEIREETILLNLNANQFAAHPRTLQRDMERLSILGFPILRINAPEGTTYRLLEDPAISDALEALNALRKKLHEEGSRHERALTSIIRKLKD